LPPATKARLAAIAERSGVTEAALVRLGESTTAAAALPMELKIG